MLSGAPGEAAAEAVGRQPTGALSGKVVFTSGGHGWTADNLGTGAWGVQRPELFEMVEDFGNQDQLTFYVEYLFRAGATVVPLRPVGHQTNEVVLDNDSAGVEFYGNWPSSGSAVYYGEPGDVPYRFEGTSAVETAYARYRPLIPESGDYPVYAWTLSGGNRASDQLYRIHYAGGTMEVTVNHRMVSGGFVYLGTYYFEAGTSGYVDISNRSDDAGKVVIADAIRFGNGMGSLDRGGGVSGHSREDEATLYWIMAQVGQGTPASEYRDFDADGTATVRAPILWAEHMNREEEGSPTDRVYLGFHSNAYNGSARGVSGLYNTGTNYNMPTPNQIGWATIVASELQDDLVAIGSPPLEYAWKYTSSPLYGASFGEIDNRVINDEFDATIIEVAFHDNEYDAKLMRDARTRDAAGRACCHGTVEYFDTYGNVATSVLPPDPVTNVCATVTGPGQVTVAWTPPAASAVGSGAATGYRVMMSENGRGFDGGTYVSGGATTSVVLTGLDPADGARHFRVAAVNEGGQSPASEVVAARPGPAGAKSVLVVNGFDRLDRYLNPRQTFGSGQIDRVWPEKSNSFDYAVQTAEAMENYDAPLRISTAANECVINGSVQLADYDAVVWILGEESTVDRTFTATEQTLVTSYVASGGDLFVSGAEIGYDLFVYGHGATFFQTTLHANYISDDAGTYAAQGVAGGMFEGCAVTFDNGSQFYDVDYPDVISPRTGATTAMVYSGGMGGGAAIQYENTATGGHLVMLGFPFETITTAASREAVMRQVLDYFHAERGSLPGDADYDGTVGAGDATILAQHWGTSGTRWGDGDFNGDGRVNATDAAILAANWGATVDRPKDELPARPAAGALIGPVPAAGTIGRRPLGSQRRGHSDATSLLRQPVAWSYTLARRHPRK